MINTRFWNDNFVASLNPLERYLFLYFLTNEHTNIAGVYELPIRLMAFETKIRVDAIMRMMERLKGKVFYIDGWVYIKNFQKHQTTSSEKVQRGIEMEMARIPQEIRKQIAILDGNDTLSEPIIYSDLDSDSNTNSDLESLPIQPTPRDLAVKFFEMVEIQGTDFQNFVKKLADKGIPAETARVELIKFHSYWTELNSTGKQQRWQKEKTFEVQKRLNTWLSRAGKWSKNTNQTKSRGFVM